MAETISYMADGGRPMAATLHRPASTGHAPFVIDVHGGAWVSGGRDDNAHAHAALAESGIGVLAVDFRMPPQARFPASLRDINAAIRWFRSQAPDLGLQPSAIGGLGWSSGGHQILLNALRPDDEEWASGQASGKARADLDFVVCCWAILDPLDRYRMALDKGLLNLVAAHKAWWPDEAAMGRANPQAVVDQGRAERLPAVLLIQGTADGNVDHRQSTRFAEAYRAAGGRADALKFDGAPHGFIKHDPASPDSLAALSAMRQFITKAGSETDALA